MSGTTGVNPLRSSSAPDIASLQAQDDSRTPERVVRAKGAASTFGVRGNLDTPVLNEIKAAGGQPTKAGKTVRFEDATDGDDSTTSNPSSPTTVEPYELTPEDTTGIAPSSLAKDTEQVDTKEPERKTYWLGKTAAILTALLPTVGLLAYALQKEEVTTVKETIQGLLYPAAPFVLSKGHSMFGTALLTGFIAYTALQFGIATSLEEQYLSADTIHTARMVASAFTGYLSGRIQEIMENVMKPAV